MSRIRDYIYFILSVEGRYIEIALEKKRLQAKQFQKYYTP